MNKGIIFEKEILDLLQRMGFEASTTKASGDGGIDIIAFKHDDISGGKFIVQCKNWSKPVGEPAVRDLYGVVISENANKGLLITRSSFTSQALRFAEGKHIELIDGNKLNELISKLDRKTSAGFPFSTDNLDDERINYLSEQIKRSPKNIILIRELADIYLLKRDFVKAIQYYEMLTSLKPTIKTARISSAFGFGLNNYGVTAALLKQYDKAFSMFKQQESYMKIPSLNKAALFHYFGMFDLAKNAYGGIQSHALKEGRDTEFTDQEYELAYMEVVPEQQRLGAFFTDENKVKLFELDSPTKRAAEECKIGMFLALSETSTQIRTAWSNLGELKFKTDYLRIYTSPDINELRELANSCMMLISECESIRTLTKEGKECEQTVSDIAETNARIFKHIYEELISLIDYLASRQVYSESMWNSLVSTPLPIYSNEELMDRLDKDFCAQVKKLDEPVSNLKTKWQAILDNERLHWQQKLNKEKPWE
ncbi:MAG: hypothetical protein COT35_09775 [Nitrospirae bacterium CG08_land_8_20_14_0_20_52_24]|nr:MAG: hypothetical protein COT35_09775 [Nitrospirae bacterium CG08_land_8_20_14_0_20_52_24]PIV82401.1 MAG: hypothetical protein COW52_13820 [Nitrospirae bacterium CG17_big_fil_post_rev_8_21_14_2_50_50_9]